MSTSCKGKELQQHSFPKGSKYHYSSYLAAIWAPKVHLLLVLGPFGFHIPAAGKSYRANGELQRTRAIRLCGGNPQQFALHRKV